MRIARDDVLVIDEESQISTTDLATIQVFGDVLYELVEAGWRRSR